MSHLTIQGVTDEQTTCDRCGKVELRRTCIVIDLHAGVEVGRYGTSCVSKVLGRKVTAALADSIEMNRRHNLRSAKVDLARGLKIGNMNVITMAVQDIARYWIRGEDAMKKLIDGMVDAANAAA
jgi:hypothetical protein